MNADYERALGQNIRRLRMERRLSQEQVSAQLQVRGCDVTRSALAKIEVVSATSIRMSSRPFGIFFTSPMRPCLSEGGTGPSRAGRAAAYCGASCC